jgi:hypothetical protein
MTFFQNTEAEGHANGLCFERGGNFFTAEMYSTMKTYGSTEKLAEFEKRRKRLKVTPSNLHEDT